MVALINSRFSRTVSIFLLITIFSLSFPAYAQYSGGTGESNAPYQIATSEDLIALGETPEDYDKHFILIDDIDLAGYVFDRAVIAWDTNDIKSSFQGTPFTGVFDGKDHTISHLTIIGKDYLGLFGRSSKGEIRNLGVLDVNITGSDGSVVGGLVGSNGTPFDGSTISLCYSIGAVSGGFESVGGLVGNNWGTLIDCYSNATVVGDDSVGGLVGYNGSTVTRCNSAGAVNGNWSVGGLAGYNSTGIVTQGYSTSAVSGNDYVGGLVGYCYGGVVIQCNSNGTVSGTSYVGGLVGYKDYGSVTQCYSNGTVSGQSYVGGLVGEAFVAIISNCYSLGSVSGQTGVGGLVGIAGGYCADMGPPVGREWGCDERATDISCCYSAGTVIGDSAIGGLIGGFEDGEWFNSYVNTSASFWDTQTSGQTTSAGGSGKITAEMQDPNTFTAAGWDFVGLSDGPHDIWAESPGGGYPVLWSQLPAKLDLPDFSGGTGEPGYPYLISTERELNSIGHNPRLMQYHFKLVDDLDLTGCNFYLIGDEFCPYTGVFDGNGHKVAHLTVKWEGWGCLGLFAYLGSGAEVKNFGVVDVNITSSGAYAGGLVGSNGGTVTQCYSTGKVVGSGRRCCVGGLVGSNWGTLIDCYSNATVVGDEWVGGLMGYHSNRGIVSQCYSTGSVSGTQYVGGLVGYKLCIVSGDGPSVRVCGSVNTSFWDIQTSGQATSAGGTGKTTAEMLTAKTFLDAGWDFVHETVNGTDNFWKMWDGYDYPRLIWEPGPNTPLVFVDINDPGFYGQMSRYEVTNAQYCDFLNAALASGDITLNGTDVEGASGSNSGTDYAGQRYYRCDGSGYTGYGANNGGAARIHYNEGAFVFDSGFGNHPVTYVSWYGAMAFSSYYGYYLPAEDQWQAVADYDGTYIYGCGETIDPGIANYRNSEHPDGTTPVGSFGIYGYGMSDMAGNVWEWTSSSLGSNRVFRGGSLGSTDSDCDVSIRGDGIPYANYWDIGFRVCR